MAYADDLLIALTKNEDLTKLIQLVENWAKGNKIQLNKNKGKSAYIKLVLRSTKNDKKDEITEGIHKENEYKYLGITIRDDMNICDGLKTAIRALNWEKSRFKVKKMKVNVTVQLNLWRTYLLGKVNYYLFTLLFCD